MLTVDKRLIDIMLRRGAYENTQYHIKETYKLKKYKEDYKYTTFCFVKQCGVFVVFLRFWICHTKFVSTQYVSYKDRKELAEDSKLIYTVSSEENGYDQLVKLDKNGNLGKYLLIIA